MVRMVFAVRGVLQQCRKNAAEQKWGPQARRPELPVARRAIGRTYRALKLACILLAGDQPKRTLAALHDSSGCTLDNKLADMPHRPVDDQYSRLLSARRSGRIVSIRRRLAVTPRKVPKFEKMYSKARPRQ